MLEMEFKITIWSLLFLDLYKYTNHIIFKILKFNIFLKLYSYIILYLN
jgi:hypothetical protein